MIACGHHGPLHGLLNLSEDSEDHYESSKGLSEASTFRSKALKGTSVASNGQSKATLDMSEILGMSETLSDASEPSLMFHRACLRSQKTVFCPKDLSEAS